MYIIDPRLLVKASHNKLFIGGQTFIFWSKKESIFENKFSMFFSSNDDPNAYVQMVKNMYEGVYSGIVNEDENNEFYLVGLNPNSARIFMSLYVEGTMRDFANNIRQHYLDIQLERKEEVPPELLSLMASITMDGKLSSLPPNLFDQVLAAVIQNHRYPIQMVQLCLMRIRADHRLSANRVSILKAYINRNERINNVIRFRKQQFRLFMRKTICFIGSYTARIKSKMNGRSLYAMSSTSLEIQHGPQ